VAARKAQDKHGAKYFTAKREAFWLLDWKRIDVRSQRNDGAPAAYRC
jgi:hypothetical protein